MHYGIKNIEKNSGAVMVKFQKKALQIQSNSLVQSYGFIAKSTSGNNIASMLYEGKMEVTSDGYGISLVKKLGKIKIILSCDNGFSKTIEQDAVLFWNKTNKTIQPKSYISNDFNITNWELKNDGNPDACLACYFDNEYYADSDSNGQYKSTSGQFYLCFRNLPSGVNRVTIIFELKQVQTEEFRIDLVCDNNTKISAFDKATDMPSFSAEYTHDLFFYPYV